MREVPFVVEAEDDMVGINCRLAAADVPKIAPLLVRASIEIFEITPHGRRLEATYLARYADTREKRLG